MEKEAKFHYLIALLLGVTGLLILVVFITVRSNTDSASTSVTVSNSSPVVDTVSINGASTITLTEGTNTTVAVTGQVTDNNGCEDVATNGSVVGRLYRTNFGQSCSSDSLNCYINNSCTLGGCTAGGSDLTATYTCNFTLAYYADATDATGYATTSWTAFVTSTDGSSATATNSATTTLNTLTALDFDGSSSISYGSVALNAASNAITTTLTNTGNDNDLDIQVSSAAAMSCTIGSIGVDQTHYSTTSAFTYANGTASVTSSPSTFDFSLAKTSNGTSSTQNLYWEVKLPITGVSGSCTGTTTVVAA